MILFDVNWEAETAGPSPTGYRTEIFLFGCKKALAGNPCKGCFNNKLWDSSIATKSYTPKEIADKINKYAPSKYVTIGGGEPTDQIEELIELCKYLKEYNFNILVYTYKEMNTIFNYNIGGNLSISRHRESIKFKKLFQYIDILIDGPFIKEECLYKKDNEDGLFNSVGSGNQIIWDIKRFRDKNKIYGYYLKNLLFISIEDNDRLMYFIEDIHINKEEINYGIYRSSN